MPIPTLITDLSTTVASNYPAGSDSPASLDDVQRAHAAFIAQLRDGTGFTAGAIGVEDGGTGRATSTTAYALLAAGTTATGAHQTLAAGATTEVLVGGGAAALPVWTTASGSGAPVRATSPALVTPALGTPTALVGTNITGTAASLTAGTVTTNANLTGHVTSTGNAAILGSFTLAQLNTAVSDADLNVAASETVSGIIEIATSAEAIAGTDTVRAITPAGLRSGFNASGTAPVYACRAWVNFNGSGVVAIRASGNVSSITDNAVGDYTVNFTTALVDANYAAVCSGALSTTDQARIDSVSAFTYLAGSVRVWAAYTFSGTSKGDFSFVQVSIFR